MPDQGKVEQARSLGTVKIDNDPLNMILLHNGKRL